MKKLQSILEKVKSWQAPEDWHKITTIDTHTAGEPLRIILSGYPNLKGESVLEKRKNAKEDYDFLRTALMWEPRGHSDMYGCIIIPPEREKSDFGVLFTHNEGYSSMCGHGIIAVTTALIETGAIPPEKEGKLKIDTPAGLIEAKAHCKNKRVESVSFLNVPSFVVDLDCTIEVPPYGKITYDLAFGGAFYAYVDGSQFSPSFACIPKEQEELVNAGKRIKKAIMAKRQIQHPFEEDLSFLYGVIFISPALNKNADSRNCCIFAEGELDRSPTGTGVSGRVALHYTKGELKLGEETKIESILGTSFSVKIHQELVFSKYSAIIPEVKGKAFITGKHEFFIDSKDPLHQGFILN